MVLQNLSPFNTTIGQVVVEKKIFEICQCIFTFSLSSPLEKGCGPSLNKPKDALCQVWLKLAQWFLKRRYLNVVNVFLLFCNDLPLEKGVALHLNKLEFPLPKDEVENVKNLQTDGQTDRRCNPVYGTLQHSPT